MKNFKKSLFFIIVFFIICFCALSFFGIKTHWGSTTTNHIKGYDTVSWGVDNGEELNITLTSDKTLNEKTLDSVQKILKKRLDLCGLGESKIYKDKDKNFFTIVLARSYCKPDRDLQDLAEYLTAKGDLTISKTEENELSNLFQMPKKNSKPSFTLNNSNVENLTFFYDNTKRSEQSTKNKLASIKFKLDSESYDKFFEVYKKTLIKRKELFELEKELKKLQKETDNKKDKNLLRKEEKIKNLREEIGKQNVEVKLDGKPFFNSNILRFFDKKNDFVGSDSRYSANDVFTFANIVKSGVLPVNMRALELNKKSSPLGENFANNATVVLIVVIALFFIVIVVKYKVIGALSIISLLGHIAFILSAYTGFLSFLPGFCLNLAGFVGMAISILLGISCIIFILQNVSENFKQNSDLYIAVKNTFKKTLKPIVMLNLIIIATTFVVMGVFAQTTDVFYFILKPLNSLLELNSQNEIFSFSYSLFCGSIGILIFEIMLTGLILNSASAFKYFRNVNFMEAKTNDRKVK